MRWLPRSAVWSRATSGLIKTSGWGVEDMTVKPRAALHIMWPVLSINPTFRNQHCETRKILNRQKIKPRNVKKCALLISSLIKPRPMPRRGSSRAGHEDFNTIQLGKHSGGHWRPTTHHGARELRAPNHQRRSVGQTPWVPHYHCGRVGCLASGGFVGQEKVPVVLDNVFRLPQRAPFP